MRAVLDTCVLYPPILREILIGVARAGAFVPIWSDRILDEWCGVARRDGPANEALVGGEIALLRAHFPDSEYKIHEADNSDLYLPDTGDIHVLALARTAQCDAIVTANLKDFPNRDLAPHGVSAIHPDAFLCSLCTVAPSAIGDVVQQVLAQARDMSGQDIAARALLKRARLPRLAKLLAQAQ